MTIKAIETRYAGCKFRSRLEARWAVFFDEMRIKWEYEYQGYECYGRLTLDDAKFGYLPDFWFPDHGLHGEVKGALTQPELTRLLNAAASLSDGSCRDPRRGNDIIVFGNVPAVYDPRLPTRLHMHKGSLSASGWVPSPEPCIYEFTRLDCKSWTSPDPCGSGDYIAGDFGGDPGIYDGRDPEMVASWLTGGSRYHDCLVTREGYKALDRALNAARSARFEHGQSGA